MDFREMNQYIPGKGVRKVKTANPGNDFATKI